MKDLVKGWVLLALLAAQGPAPAAQFDGGPAVRDGRVERGGQPRISMGDAMEIARRHTRGRVLQAQPALMSGRAAYRVKVLTPQGEVRVVHVDAETGAVE